MNWMKLFRRKPLCLIDSTAVLHKTAAISNNLGDAHAIQIGAFSHIKGEILTFGHGGKIIIGDYCFIGEQTRVWSSISIEIGSRVLLSHNVNVFDNLTHPISARKRHEQFKAIITRGHPKQLDLSEKPVVIKNDVWIGCLSIVLPGITIGEGAIIGAGSVVTKDVPPWTIVAGNPAQIVREIPPTDR